MQRRVERSFLLCRVSVSVALVFFAAEGMLGCSNQAQLINATNGRRFGSISIPFVEKQEQPAARKPASG